MSLISAEEIEALTDVLMQRLQCNDDSMKLRPLDEECARLCGSSSSTLAQEIAEAPQNAAATAMEWRPDRKPKRVGEGAGPTVLEIAAPTQPARWPTKTIQMMTAYSLQ